MAAAAAAERGKRLLGDDDGFCPARTSDRVLHRTVVLALDPIPFPEGTTIVDIDVVDVFEGEAPRWVDQSWNEEGGMRC